MITQSYKDSMNTSHMIACLTLRVNYSTQHMRNTAVSRYRTLLLKQNMQNIHQLLSQSSVLAFPLDPYSKESSDFTRLFSHANPPSSFSPVEPADQPHQD